MIMQKMQENWCLENSKISGKTNIKRKNFFTCNSVNMLSLSNVLGVDYETF